MLGGNTKKKKNATVVTLQKVMQWTHITVASEASLAQ